MRLLQKFKGKQNVAMSTNRFHTPGDGTVYENDIPLGDAKYDPRMAPCCESS